MADTYNIEILLKAQLEEFKKVAGGMDLQSATRASAAAIQGKTELLSRYIPILSECKTDEEKFAKVQELSRSGFAQAKAEADSTLGKLKGCANAWGVW